MKILLDACVGGPVQADLRANGHDVIWVGDWETDPGDEQILGQAFAETANSTESIFRRCSRLPN